jgi:hypothetical protein
MTRAEIKARLRKQCAGVGHLLECLRKLDAMEFGTALSAFQARHLARYGYCPSEAAIARAIPIDPHDFRRVKLGQIPAGSVMSASVSRFLDGDTEIARPRPGGRPKKQVGENHTPSY